MHLQLNIRCFWSCVEKKDNYSDQQFNTFMGTSVTLRPPEKNVNVSL